MPPRDPYVPVPTAQPKQVRGEVATTPINIRFDPVHISGAVGDALEKVGQQGYGTLSRALEHTARAYDGFGKQLEGAGDQLWNRAIGLQQLDNETKEKKALTELERYSLDQRLEFSKKVGDAATPEVMRAHLDDLEKKRQELRDKLPRASQSAFDSTSINLVGREGTHAANHTAQQMKVSALGASNARVDLSVKRLSEADNPQEAAGAVNEIRNEIRGTTGPIQGLTPEEVEVATKARVEKGIAAWATKTSVTDPTMARQIMQDNKQWLISPGIEEQVERSIRANEVNIVSRNIAARATQDLKTSRSDADREKEPTEQEVVERAEKELDEKHPDMDAAGRETTIRRTIGEYRREMQIRKSNEDKNERVVQATILGKKNPNGERPQNMDEYNAQGGDEAKAALRSLPFKKQRAYEKLIMSGDVLDTPEIQLDHKIWQGRAKNFEDIDDIRQVLEHDFFQEKWPLNRIADMFEKQMGILRGEHKNIPLTYALRVAGPQLPPALKADPDKYAEFKGAMADAIIAHQQMFHTFPDTKKIQELTKEWVKEEAGTRGLMGWFSGPRFEPDYKWLQQSERENPDLTTEERAHEYRTQKAKEILEMIYKGAPAPFEPPALKYMREHGGTRK